MMNILQFEVRGVVLVGVSKTIKTMSFFITCVFLSACTTTSTTLHYVLPETEVAFVFNKDIVRYDDSCPPELTTSADVSISPNLIPSPVSTSIALKKGDINDLDIKVKVDINGFLQDGHINSTGRGSEIIKGLSNILGVVSAFTSGQPEKNVNSCAEKKKTAIDSYKVQYPSEFSRFQAIDDLVKSNNHAKQANLLSWATGTQKKDLVVQLNSGYDGLNSSLLAEIGGLRAHYSNWLTNSFSTRKTINKKIPFSKVPSLCAPLDQVLRVDSEILIRNPSLLMDFGSISIDVPAGFKTVDGVAVSGSKKSQLNHYVAVYRVDDSLCPNISRLNVVDHLGKKSAERLLNKQSLYFPTKQTYQIHIDYLERKASEKDYLVDKASRIIQSVQGYDPTGPLNSISIGSVLFGKVEASFSVTSGILTELDFDSESSLNDGLTALKDVPSQFSQGLVSAKNIIDKRKELEVAKIDKKIAVLDKKIELVQSNTNFESEVESADIKLQLLLVAEQKRLLDAQKLEVESRLDLQYAETLKLLELDTTVVVDKATLSNSELALLQANLNLEYGDVLKRLELDNSLATGRTELSTSELALILAEVKLVAAQQTKDEAILVELAKILEQLEQDDGN